MVAKLGTIALAACLMCGTSPAIGAPPADKGTPTCSDTLGIEVHGQHIIGDYVTGIAHDELEWPPQGQDIGEIIAANGGVVIAGGPGPGFHFEFGVAPGASFCTGSESPGAHL